MAANTHGRVLYALDAPINVLVPVGRYNYGADRPNDFVFVHYAKENTTKVLHSAATPAATISITTTSSTTNIQHFAPASTAASLPTSKSSTAVPTPVSLSVVQPLQPASVLPGSYTSSSFSFFERFKCCETSEGVQAIWIFQHFLRDMLTLRSWT